MIVNQAAIQQMPYSELKALLIDIQKVNPKEIGITKEELKALKITLLKERISRFSFLFLDDAHFEAIEKERKEKIAKLVKESKFKGPVDAEDKEVYYLQLRKLNEHVSKKLKLGVTERMTEKDNLYTFDICTKKTKNKTTVDVEVVQKSQYAFHEQHVSMEVALGVLADLVMPPAPKMEPVK